MKKEIAPEVPKKFLYHKEHGAKLFDLHEQPEGWVDSPALFESEISESLDEELGKVKPKKGKK